MNVVITGVTSFIGKATAECLLAEGHSVLGVVRPQSRNLQKLSGVSGLRLCRLDFDVLPEAEDWSGDVSRQLCAEMSVQLAAETGRQFDDTADSATLSVPAATDATNTTATTADVWIHFAWDGVGSAGRSDTAIQARNLANAKKAWRLANRLGCRRFLFAGSQAEYGGGTKEHPEPVSAYGKAKLAFGAYVQQELQRNQCMDFVHMRIYSVYGAGDHETSLVNTCLRSFLAGEEMCMGACTQQWNYMEIRDCARAIALLAGTTRSRLLAAAQNSSALKTGGQTHANAFEQTQAPQEKQLQNEAFQICGQYLLFDLAAAEGKPLREYVLDMHALCGGRGSCSFGVRADNAEGAKDLLPDTSALQALGFRERISFAEGIRNMIAAM